MKNIDVLLSTITGKFVKISISECSSKIPFEYCVEFHYPTFNRPVFIYTNCIYQGLYWYLYGNLQLSRKVHTGISVQVLLRMLSDLRRCIAISKLSKIN